MPRKSGAKTRRRRAEENAIERSPTYQKFYATNVMAWPTDSDVRIDFFNEKQPHKRHFDYTTDAGVILTPEAAVVLRNQLSTAIEIYEKRVGSITIRPGRKPVLDTQVLANLADLPSD